MNWEPCKVENVEVLYFLLECRVEFFYVDVVVAGLKEAGELAGLKETRELTSALGWLSFYSQRSKQALRNSVEITHRHDSYKSMISYRGRHQRERMRV